MKSIKNWLSSRRAKAKRRREIISEMENIAEMLRLNTGIARASINNNIWPSAPRTKPEYSDYACAKSAILLLQGELEALK